MLARRIGLIIAVYTLAMFMLGFLAGRALAQMPGDHGFRHAENHDWYRGLMSPITHGSCCSGNENDGDCRQTRAYHDDVGWHALVDGRWRLVPAQAILSKDPPDGNCHVCVTPQQGIICFMRCGPKS